MLQIFTFIADYFTYQIFNLTPKTHLAEAVHFFIEDVTKIFFLIFVMTTLVSFVRNKLRPEKIKSYLEGKPKWLAYILAAVLGAVTPFCSCSSIPLFIGFIEAGIPFGITMTFLITSPLINEIAIVVFASAVGPYITFIYAATGMIIGLIGGLFMEKMKFEKYVEKYVFEIRMSKLSIEQNEKIPLKTQIKYALSYSKEILSKIWLFVIIGIAIGSGLHGFVPHEFFATYAGSNNFFAVPLAVISGIPLYSNATGVIPIAEALLNKGVPLGTVLAMMMSVVAISLPEIIILRRVLQTKLIIYFILFLLVAFISVGYLYNFIF